MAAVTADDTVAVDADQDARVLHQRVSPRSTPFDGEDEIVSESAPLLGRILPEAADTENDFPDNINKPWLGSLEFNAKPVWRRPSV